MKSKENPQPPPDETINMHPHFPQASLAARENVAVRFREKYPEKIDRPDLHH